jgi:hypothetical protein
MRFLFLHPIDAISILSFQTQGCKGVWFTPTKYFKTESKRESVVIPIAESGFIAANSRSKLPEVNIVFHNMGHFLHGKLTEGFLGIPDWVVGTEIAFELA